MNVRRRRPRSATSSEEPNVKENIRQNENQARPRRSFSLWLGLLIILLHGSWLVYSTQYVTLPVPLNAEQAGKRGFSENSAMQHVVYLTGLGPHSVGSESLDRGVQYVYAAAEAIKKTANRDVDIQVELFHANSGANRLVSGLFQGKSLVYSDLKHVLLRIVPKYLPEAEDNVILVSSHIDTVFSTEGASDCSSCVGVMLELARAVSQWAHGFKSGVLFLFNTGEEEGLSGAHSFITQHHWSSSVRFAIDVEAMGIGGKSMLFQGGSSIWALESYAAVSKNPIAQVIAQDFFGSGAIKSATDLQIYRDVAGLPGLDFAYLEHTAVYHTKNDKLQLLRPGSLQHLGENLLAFILHTSASSKLNELAEQRKKGDDDQDQAVFFDILGKYMFVYSQRLATMLNYSVIFQSLLIWAMSLFMGGLPGVISFAISLLGLVLMWMLSILCSITVAFLLPLICPFATPYLAHPWLVISLFGAPALFGAFSGQHIGFLLIKKYLTQKFTERARRLSKDNIEHIAELEAERWVFKSGFLQWLVLLAIGSFLKVGSSYIALIWLASPSFAYGLMEATLSPVRTPKQLKVVTLVLGMAAPIVSSAGLVLRFGAVIIGTIIRLDRNPGGMPDWLSNVMVAILVVAIVNLMFVYILTYVHLSGAKRPFSLLLVSLLAVSVTLVSTGVVPAFTEDVARTINVVHVVDKTNYSSYNTNPSSSSYISLFSNTPGKLKDELNDLAEEGFICGRGNATAIDFVTFKVNYGCRSYQGADAGWNESEVPVFHVVGDSTSDAGRTTVVAIDTKHSTRWALAINKREVQDFSFRVDSTELIPLDDKGEVDGWHTIQFAGGKDSPTNFELTIVWASTAHSAATAPARPTEPPSAAPLLLKLRTDVNRVTPKAARVMEKLPKWCSPFGKSTSPLSLAFLISLPVSFSY